MRAAQPHNQQSQNQQDRPKEDQQLAYISHNFILDFFQ